MQFTIGKALFKCIIDKSIVKNVLRKKELYCCNLQHFRSICGLPERALVLGVYRYDKDDAGQQITLTPTGERYNEKTGQKLMDNLQLCKPVPRLGDVRILFGIDPYFNIVAVTGLGDPCLCYNIYEHVDERKEAIRTGIGVGVKALQNFNVQVVCVDSCGHAESAAEGASMASWLYQELKDGKNPAKLVIPTLQIFDSADLDGWQVGLHKASAQNLARHMMETPANLLTPSSFAQSAVEILSKYAVNVEIRMHNWAKLRNMNAFLAVGAGSCEPPVFLELLYEGCDPDICPIVMIGKGTTFDSGGICLKSCIEEMKHQRGDMSGAASVVATFRAVASLQLPLNIRGLIPLCVNSIGASAMKPGDTVKAMNGKTILIENTDHADGLLLLADALCYSKLFDPKCIIDIGTITQGAEAAIGSAASVVFSNSDSLYETLRIASIHTGDRIWRFPLWNYYGEYLNSTTTADVTNLVAPGTGGEPGKAAAFLREFAPEGKDWIHIDSYSVTRTTGKVFSYLREGMAGRPTRTLIEFLAQLCCRDTGEKKSC